MSTSQDLRTALSARLAIKDANQTIRTAKQTIAMKEADHANKLWAKYKEGNAGKVFFTTQSAKRTIALAASEVNTLAGGPPASAASEDASAEEKIWKNERRGVHQLFYKSDTAHAVLKLAAAEFNSLKSGAAPAAAKPAAPAPAAKTAPSTTTVAANPTTAAPATKGPELTGLARVSAAFKAQSAPPTAAKPEAKAPTPASNLTGLAKVTAAFKSQSKKN